MSQRTRIIILMGIVLFVASCLYPPWETVQQDISIRGAALPKIHRDCGWGPIWRSTYTGYNMSDASLAWPRLAVEWAIIAAVTGGMVLLVGALGSAMTGVAQKTRDAGRGFLTWVRRHKTLVVVVLVFLSLGLVYSLYPACWKAVTSWTSSAWRQAPPTPAQSEPWKNDPVVAPIVTPAPPAVPRQPTLLEEVTK